MYIKAKLKQLPPVYTGSACRSLYGGAVKWMMGKETNGSDNIVVQLETKKHWEELVILVAVVSSH